MALHTNDRSVRRRRRRSTMYTSRYEAAMSAVERSMTSVPCRTDVPSHPHRVVAAAKQQQQEQQSSIQWRAAPPRRLHSLMTCSGTAVDRRPSNVASSHLPWLLIHWATTTRENVITVVVVVVVVGGGGVPRRTWPRRRDSCCRRSMSPRQLSEGSSRRVAVWRTRYPRLSQTSKHYWVVAARWRFRRPRPPSVSAAVAASSKGGVGTTASLCAEKARLCSRRTARQPSSRCGCAAVMQSSFRLDFIVVMSTAIWKKRHFNDVQLTVGVTRHLLCIARPALTTAMFCAGSDVTLYLFFTYIFHNVWLCWYKFWWYVWTQNAHKCQRAQVQTLKSAVQVNFVYLSTLKELWMCGIIYHRMLLNLILNLHFNEL